MIVALRARHEPERLSRAFARAVGGRSSEERSGPRLLLGLEHEFRVLAEGRPIDFGRLIHELPIPGRRVDPADPNAYRGSWGGSITADGAEAEIAIPPVASGPGCTAELLELATSGRRLLSSALPAGATLEGYSTHFSVAVPDRLVERAARLYVRTFAPALMLLLDGPASPGLLVRPRPGRLELGGEFVDGERLRAVAAFVAGSVRAVTVAARRRPFAGRHLPPRIAVAAAPAVERFGWFAARDAVGTDLYATGRKARLPLEGGGEIDADTYLARCWQVARRQIDGLVGAADLAAADRLVAGRIPLGLEVSQAEAIAMAPAKEALRSAPRPAGPFGRAIEVRSRGTYTVSPELVSWDFAVLRLETRPAAGSVHTAYACLPRATLAEALDAFDAGRLDGLVSAFLAAEPRRAEPMLMARRQTAAAGLFRGIGRAAELVAKEHSPLGEAGGRPGKRRRDPQHSSDPTTTTPNSPGPAGAAAGAGAASVAAAAGASGAAAAIAGAAGPTSILGLPVAVAAAIGGLVVVAVVAAVAMVGGATVSPSSAPAIVTPSAVVAGSASPVAVGTTPTPPASPRPLPTPDPSCLREPTLKSTDGATPKNVLFVNDLEVPLEKIWLDYTGHRVVYGEVAPGASSMQPTFLTHPWIFATAAGECLLLVVTESSTDVVKLGP